MNAPLNPTLFAPCRARRERVDVCLRPVLALSLAASLPDRRSTRGGPRIPFKALIHTLMLGMLTARRSLEDVEVLTTELHPKVRLATGIDARISDSSLRDAQMRLYAADVRPLLHAQVKAAQRNKQLAPVDLPFHFVAIDGKGQGCVEPCEHEAVQVCRPEKRAPYGLLRVHRSTLISAKAAVCLDERPIEGHTNEIGAIGSAIIELVDAYHHTSLVEVIMSDAGNSSAATATLIDELNKGYILRLTDMQGGIFVDAVEALSACEPIAERVEWVRRGDKTQAKEVRRLYRCEPRCDRPYRWGHLRSWLLVERIVYDETGEAIHHGRRYSASNIPFAKLTPEQWLRVMRWYWRCENDNHGTNDRFWKEDAKRRPWTKDAETALMLSILRQIAINVLALVRSRRRQPGQRRALSWRAVIERARTLLVAADLMIIEDCYTA